MFKENKYSQGRNSYSKYVLKVLHLLTIIYFTIIDLC